MQMWVISARSEAQMGKFVVIWLCDPDAWNGHLPRFGVEADWSMLLMSVDERM